MALSHTSRLTGFQLRFSNQGCESALDTTRGRQPEVPAPPASSRQLEGLRGPARPPGCVQQSAGGGVPRTPARKALMPARDPAGTGTPQPPERVPEPRSGGRAAWKHGVQAPPAESLSPCDVAERTAPSTLGLPLRSALPPRSQRGRRRTTP